MAPHRIMFIRHAEKPDASSGTGIDADGKPDEESLAVRGWQRAGALVRFFCPAEDSPATLRRPGTVFAPGTGPASESRRAMQTVTPLVAKVRETSKVEFITTYLKDDGEALMKDVLTRAGVVLISWEHKVLPTLIGHVPGAPAVPSKWPDKRFDMVWVLDRDDDTWSFSQLPQLLLAGDSDEPIR